MSGTLVKRQHYVWRRYLRAWSTGDESICVHFKSTVKTINSNLMNVGQMRYFYKMEVLNDAEKKLCRDFIMSYQGNDVIDFDLRTLYFYEAYANMVKLRESDPNIRQQYPDIDDWSYEDEFDPQVNISKATFYSKSA